MYSLHLLADNCPKLLLSSLTWQFELIIILCYVDIIDVALFIKLVIFLTQYCGLVRPIAMIQAPREGAVVL